MDQPDHSPDLNELQRPLELFRARTVKHKIHPTELALLWVVSAHFIFLAWALGGMHLWAQWTSLGLGLVSLAVALIPREYTQEHTGSNVFRLVMWPRLLKFPLFWLGFVLLACGATQAYNPAWVYETDGKVSWMRAMPNIAWLPAGVRVPFEQWGPWRMFVIYAAAWLAVCAIWVGFTRRRTVQLFFIVIAANGMALAGLGVAQKLISNGRIYWTLESPNASFFASFIYKNHGGNYLNLALAVACGLGAWYFLRGVRRLEKSNPSGVFAFLATCIAVAILVSYARGATVAMLLFLGFCVAGFVLHQWSIKDAPRSPIITIAMLAVFGGFLKVGLEALNSSEAWDRLRKGVMSEDVSLESRREARAATFEMLQANWVRGTGAGSFRFLFPVYQQSHGSILKAGEEQLVWEHAHNDILEIAAEQGLLGMAIIVAAWMYLGVGLVRKYFWQNPLSGCVALGVLFTLFQAWWDFPLQCPAVLLLWSEMAVLALLWATFEQTNAAP